MSGFKKAQRQATKFKGSIQGASGSGKTYSALKIATALVARTDPGKRIAVIDTEKSAEVYAPPFDFDVDNDFGEGAKLSYDYRVLLAKLETARKSGEYGAVIIDSMTHFWKEQGGFTRMIDAICDAQRARGGKGDSFAAWKQVDPLYREMMTYIRQYPLHIILCMRAKQAYDDVVENGRKKKVKVGMEPEFRDAFEFEMDAQFAIDADHVMVPLKHRLQDRLDGKVFRNPGDDVASIVHEWLLEGAPGQELPKVIVDQEPNGPDTTPIPPTQPPNAQEATAFDNLVAELEAARGEAEVKAFASKVSEAKKANLLSTDELAKLNALYKAKLQAVRSNGATQVQA